MKYERFEDLPVWKAAADLGAEMLAWATQPWFRGKGDLGNQIQRAILSVSNNIAEGFERGSTAELLQFLYYARGSAGEVRSMLSLMERMQGCEHFSPDIARFKARCENISRQLRGWANSLQNSEIKGQRYLNDETRQSYQQKQKRQAFQAQLDAANDRLQQKLASDQERRDQADQQRDSSQRPNSSGGSAPPSDPR